MTTATLTLSDFLLARIAEDEANIDGDWTAGYGLHILSMSMYDRMKRAVAAKRRIVERADELAHIPNMDRETAGRAFEYDDYVLAALAAVYSDHPDYLSEWAF